MLQFLLEIYDSIINAFNFMNDECQYDIETPVPKSKHHTITISHEQVPNVTYDTLVGETYSLKDLVKDCSSNSTRTTTDTLSSSTNQNSAIFDDIHLDDSVVIDTDFIDEYCSVPSSPKNDPNESNEGWEFVSKV